MSCLTLVGTIHRDPNGLPRLMETLERETLDIITLEMSEYGGAFRESIGHRLEEDPDIRLHRPLLGITETADIGPEVNLP